MSVIATAGHVDHGKSSLVRAITGTDPDRLAEEQRKGMTIDLGFAHAVTATGTTLSFIDVPGHIDFVRTMISGVSGVDVALLVIDAHEGWKPQTEEHVGILEVLGVSRGIVALSKADKLVQSELDERIRQVSSRLSESSVTWMDVIPTSVIDGRGIDALVTSLERTMADSSATRTSPARLFVDRVFTIRGAGTVVTGTLEGSPVSVADTLEVARTGELARVRDVQSHGVSIEAGSPGSRCALNITGVDTNSIRRGDALVAPGTWLTTTVFDATFTALAALKRPVTNKGSFTVHIGTSAQSATMRIVTADSVQPGEMGTVRIRFNEPLPLRPGDRYLLRDTGIGMTIGGGAIVNVDPRGRLIDAVTDASVDSIMRGRGFVPVELARRLTGIDLEPTVGNWFAVPDELTRVTETLQTTLDRVGAIDVATIEPHERDVLETITGVIIDNGVARRSVDDPTLAHPYVAMFREAGIVTPDAKSLDRNIVRQLVHKGILFEHDFIAFHVDTLNALRSTLEELWHSHPDGFTVSHLREKLSITRKHAVPLAECLDKFGLTRRIEDRRVRGHRW